MQVHTSFFLYFCFIYVCFLSVVLCHRRVVLFLSVMIDRYIIYIGLRLGERTILLFYFFLQITIYIAG